MKVDTTWDKANEVISHGLYQIHFDIKLQGKCWLIVLVYVQDIFTVNASSYCYKTLFVTMQYTRCAQL